MKRVIFLFICGFISIQLLKAQDYHFNKGEKYLRIGWYDSAFKEYLEGMKTGEASSAFMVAWCYLNETGTPRNVSKAIAVLDQWSDKDVNICFYNAVFNDPSISVRNVKWTEDKVFSKEVKRFYAPTLVGNYEFYGHKAQIAGDYNLPYNIDKAIKYAQKLEKKVNSDALRDFINLLKTKKLTTSGDFETALSVIGNNADNVIYYDVLQGALGSCSTLEDISRIIDLDNAKRSILSIEKATIDNYHVRDCNELLADKCSFFYNVLLESNDGDTSLLKESVKKEPKTQKAIEIGLSISAVIDGYVKKNVNGLTWICNNVPFNKPKETARTVWSRCMLKDFMLNRVDSYWNSENITDNYLSNTDWSAILKIFNSPYYIEVDGYSLIPKGYMTNQIELDRLITIIKEKNKNTSPGSYDQPTEYYQAEKIITNLRFDNEKIKNFNWENVSTKKAEYQSIKELSTKRINLLLSQKQTFKGITFEQYLNKVMRGESNINSSYLNTIIQNSTKILSSLDSMKDDYGDEAFSSLKEKALSQKEFAEFLSKELLKKTMIDDYITFSKSGSMYSNYAKSKLSSLRQERQTKEKMIDERVGFNSKDIKKYEGFVSICQSGARKKIKLETAEIVKNNVIVPALKMCSEAYSIYPIDEKSLQQRKFEEELAVIEIIQTYEKNKDVLTLSDSFLKQYASSPYTNLIQDYYNDSNAIRMANMLTSQSSKDEIEKVLALPMTKEAEKIVKKLTSNLKTKN